MIRLLFILFTLFLPGCASMVSSRSVDIKGEKFTSGGRSQILPNNDEPGSRMTVNVNTDIFKYGYWDNRVWGMTNQSKFAATGWNYQLGVRMTPIFNVFYEHHSQHRLDTGWAPNQGFPVEDSVGVVLKVYNREPAGESVFK